MIYVVLAGFFAFSMFGVHQNKMPEKVVPAQIQPVKQKVLIAPKVRALPKRHVAAIAMLDGIELKDLSDKHHA